MAERDSALLVGALLDGASSFDDCAIRRFAAMPATVDTSPIRPITVDQTHESVVVGERVVVKWYRSAAPARALTLIAHLAEVGFTGTPSCYAALMRGDAPAALVTENLPGARDGWEWCVEAFGDDFGAVLGELAASLHAALATASSVLPAPVRPSSTQDRAEWAAQAEAALAEVLALTDGPDGEWLASVAPLLRRDLTPLSSPQPVPLLRVHGDLHVGQILRWPGGYRVIDFDGNPTAAERAEHQPAARDVAQLLTSLDHVAMIVAKTSDRAAALARARELRADLLAGYRATPAARGLLDADEGLLRAFEVEQECRELIYAAKFLPRWRYAPIGVLRTWYA